MLITPSGKRIPLQVEDYVPCICPAIPLEDLEFAEVNVGKTQEETRASSSKESVAPQVHRDEVPSSASDVEGVPPLAVFPAGNAGVVLLKRLMTSA